MVDFDRFWLLTFDCYGTLIDWERGILDAIRPVLSRHGVDAGDDSILETYAAAESKLEQGDFVRYEIVLREVFTELCLRFGFDASPEEIVGFSASIGRWRPFPDTVASLRALRTRYKLAVISNVDDRLFELTQRRLPVRFDWVITAQQAGAYKPSLRTFEYAFDKFGMPRERFLHVAQSVCHDIVPARALGVTTVWINRRKGLSGSGATLPAQGRPDVEVADLRSLVDLTGLGRRPNQ